LLELLGVVAQIVEQQIGHVVGHPGPHDDPQHREVLAVLGEAVGGHLPAAPAQACRDVEDGVVLDLGLSVKANTGSSEPSLISS
jgi:hypothetical protein